MPASKFVQLYVTVIAVLLALSALLWSRPDMMTLRERLLPRLFMMTILIELALIMEQSVVWKEFGADFPHDLIFRPLEIDDLKDRRFSGFALANLIFVSLPPVLAIVLLLTSPQEDSPLLFNDNGIVHPLMYLTTIVSIAMMGYSDDRPIQIAGAFLLIATIIAPLVRAWRETPSSGETLSGRTNQFKPRRRNP